MKLNCLLACLLLSGCGGLINVKEDLAQLRKPPAEAMRACQTPKPLESDEFGAVVEKLQEVAGVLKQCGIDHAQLIKWVDQTAK